MSPVLLYAASVGCLVAFGVLGSFDGVYFHLMKYRLHEHRESLTEHLLHAMRGVLFTPIAYLFYVVPSAGKLLWLGLAVVAADLCVEVCDILVEKSARENLGGISPTEQVVHVMATAFRMASLAFILSTKPAAAFSWWSATVLPDALPLHVQLVGWVMFVSSSVGACSHVWLLRGRGGVWAPASAPPRRIAGARLRV
jgi:hypothetical protein